MKELYKEYFHVPKHGKIRDKVMLVRTAVMVVAMVVCLATMSLTTYAWFSYDVTSGMKVIEAANFEANVSINADDQTATVENNASSKTKSAELPAGTYTIKLYRSDSTTAETGFCIVTIGGNKYHTQQIGVDGSKTTGQITFTLAISETTKLTILSHWGTSSCYGYENADRDPMYIKDGAVLDLADDSTDDAAGETEEEEDPASNEMIDTTETMTDDITGQDMTPPEETTASTETMQSTQTAAPPETTVTEPVETTPNAEQPQTDNAEGSRTPASEEVQ